MNRAGKLALAVACLSAVAGCGSTAQQTGTTALTGAGLTVDGSAPQPGATAGSGLTVPGSGPAAQTGSGPSSTITGPGSSTVPGATATVPGSTTPTGGPHGQQSQGTNGLGITDDAIYVGISYTVNGDEANAALGAAGITQGDTKADAKAVIDEINANGGVAGRKLVPVWYAFDANSTDTYSDQDQQECATFTQDNHVFATTDSGLTDTFMRCMQNAGVLSVFSGSLIAQDEPYFQQYPNYFNVGSVGMDRMLSDEVSALARQKYFTGWNPTLGQPSTTAATKIGILGVDDPTWTRPIQDVLLPKLAAAGYHVDPQDVALVHNPNSTGEDGQTVSDIQQAELKFNQDGVNHVIMLDANGSLMIFFANAARSQHYYPRLGVNSATGMQALYDSSAIDANQLAGAVGLGWAPSIDLTAKAGDQYATPATKHCLEIMKRRTGQTYDSTNAASLALSYCDSLFVLADAIDHAGPVLNEATVQAALEAIHGNFTPAGMPGFYLSPTQHDAAVTGFDLYWDSNCTCARYRNEHRIPSR